MNHTEETRVRKILSDHGLSDAGLTKAPAGFRNAVWLTDTAAVKLYSPSCGDGMAKERWIYRDVRPAFAPKLLGEGEDCLCIERIRGESLFHLWYRTDEPVRRDCIRKVGKIVSGLQELTFPEPNCFSVPEDWQTHLLTQTETLLARLKKIPDSIPEALAAEAGQYIRSHMDAFDDTELYPVYSDLHFDNLLVSPDGKITLIDYEMMEAAPRDFLLDVWHRMLLHPFTYASEEDHEYTKPEDYRQITAWLREEVPSLFAHPRLQERVNIYSLLYELDILTEYPGADWPIERIHRWLDGDCPV